MEIIQKLIVFLFSVMTLPIHIGEWTISFFSIIIFSIFTAALLSMIYGNAKKEG